MKIKIKTSWPPVCLTSLRFAAICCCVGVGGAGAAGAVCPPTPPVASMRGEMSPVWRYGEYAAAIGSWVAPMYGEPY